MSAYKYIMGSNSSQVKIEVRSTSISVVFEPKDISALFPKFLCNGIWNPWNLRIHSQ